MSVSEFLLVLRDEWYSSHEFLTSIPISDKKYKYLKSKYKNSFYFFNNQLDYNFEHHFRKFKTIKDNMNKFLIDVLMTLLIKKLSYKNANQWI